MKSKVAILLLLGLTCKSCSMFEQNDFIATEKFKETDTETFIYSAFKTGIDNYRIEFKVIADKDTSKLFDYFINDALYTKEHSFKFSSSNDTVTISAAFPTDKKYYKTKNGTIVELTNEPETKPRL